MSSITIAGGLAVQSYCFRGFKTNPEVARLTREIGVAAIELCGVHAKFGEPATFPEVLAAYRDAGVAVVSIGVETIDGDEAKARHRFEFARAAGARFMSVSFPLRGLAAALRAAERLAAEYDLRLGIHNHGGRHWLGNADALDWVLGQCGERIGLCLDTAWALDSKEDPVALVRRFGGRVHGLHLKDFVFDRAGKPADVVVGSGNLDLAGLREALGAVGFAGYAVIEYEGDVGNPVPALQQCVGALAPLGA